MPALGAFGLETFGLGNWVCGGSGSAGGLGRRGVERGSRPRSTDDARGFLTFIKRHRVVFCRSFAWPHKNRGLGSRSAPRSARFGSREKPGGGEASAIEAPRPRRKFLSDKEAESSRRMRAAREAPGRRSRRRAALPTPGECLMNNSGYGGGRNIARDRIAPCRPGRVRWRESARIRED